jgi:23S rRNA pseudouridine1911/1915/1917 synthase
VKNATPFTEADSDREAQDADPGLPGAQTLVAGDDAEGRLDAWLAAELEPDLSRSRIKALIEAGAVTVNGVTAKQAKHKINPGDRVELEMPEPEDADPLGEDIPLEILYEDDDLIVINKQAGLVVHPGAGNWTGTLVNALIHHCGDSLSGIGGVRRPGIVHRLDRDTTGVMVVAKNDLGPPPPRRAVRRSRQDRTARTRLPGHRLGQAARPQGHH